VIPKPRKSLDSLATLNRKSRELAFGLEDIDWSVPVDRAKPWAPEEVGPIWFTPTFAELEPAQRVRCNQLHALRLCEKFIWFEEQLIRAVGNILRERALPVPLREALEHFVSEETKHVEMFWRLLAKSEPAWYQPREFRLFELTALQRSGMNLVVDRPDLLLAWIWVAIFVEERTLYLSRLYMSAAKEAPAGIDALHTRVHEYHFRDEARHYQLDQHLLTWLYDPQPRWKKTLGAAIFRVMARAYVAPGGATVRIAQQLGHEFPGLRSHIIPRLLAEIPAVFRNVEYHRKLFSRASFPHTLALLAEYPEHDRLWELFITERKHPA